MSSIPGSVNNSNNQLQQAQQMAQLQSQAPVTEPMVSAQTASAAVSSSGVIGGRNVVTSSTTGPSPLSSAPTTELRHLLVCLLHADRAKTWYWICCDCSRPFRTMNFKRVPATCKARAPRWPTQPRTAWPNSKSN